ncbi:DUF887-domain-containing protein [Dendrothele bispora CBS 962.96]|uniref:DUF887-domain-containing protein n=1 Tax=Dendrothele bispora (strain CBS 962.96) TaxID=1314807 RepID=A0A4S8LA22_DENBC|nr:DUF887-domain-containing protein [Dendrothele bispora CBS 962.96]
MDFLLEQIVGLLSSTPPPIAYLTEKLTPVALSLGLTTLPENLPVFLWSFFLFSVVHQVLAPLICSLSVNGWETMGRKARNNWAIHVVSQIHAFIIVPLALRAIESPELDADRAFGTDRSSSIVAAVASGYFIWDTLDAIVNFVDLGFVVHGAACSAIYMLSFKPFLAYYASRCLLWEASTIFLNNHWFLDKTGRTGSTLQLINGGFLLFTFLGVRIVYGGFTSYNFFQTLAQVKDEIPLAYVLVYGGGNVVLNGLNWFWFTKMVAALRKRFNTGSKTT